MATRSRAAGYMDDWRMYSTDGISLCSCRTTTSHREAASTSAVLWARAWSSSAAGRLDRRLNPMTTRPGEAGKRGRKVIDRGVAVAQEEDPSAGVRAPRN